MDGELELYGVQRDSPGLGVYGRELELVYREESPWENEDRLQAFLQEILSLCEVRVYRISLCFCSQQFIRDLNKKYRCVDMSTDILTFENTLPFQQGVGGDIVVALEVVRGQAQELGISFQEELKRTLIHGLLHLVGYTHQSYDATEPMLLYQEYILNKVKERALL